MPIFYGNKMRRKMKAGAGCEDLKVRCPHYYSVATRLHAAQQACLTADEAFPAFILNTFRSRYKVRGCCVLCAVHVWRGACVCCALHLWCGAGMCLSLQQRRREGAASPASHRTRAPAPPDLALPACLQELLTKAPQIESSLEATQIQGKLSSEEAQVCVAGELTPCGCVWLGVCVLGAAGRCRGSLMSSGQKRPQVWA